MSPRGGARSSSHTALVQACLHWLELHHVFAWKNNTGAFRTQAGGFVRASFPGCSDILGMLDGGRLLAVECKTGRGELTKGQQAFRKKVERAGGLYVLARSLDDLAHGLGWRSRIA